MKKKKKTFQQKIATTPFLKITAIKEGYYNNLTGVKVIYSGTVIRCFDAFFGKLTVRRTMLFYL